MREMLIYSVPRSIKAGGDDATTREPNEEEEEGDSVKTWVRKGTRLISSKKDRESLLITSAPSCRSRGSWLDQAEAGTKLSFRNRNTFPNSLVKRPTGSVQVFHENADVLLESEFGGQSADSSLAVLDGAVLVRVGEHEVSPCLGLNAGITLVCNNVTVASVVSHNVDKDGPCNIPQGTQEAALVKLIVELSRGSNNLTSATILAASFK